MLEEFSDILEDLETIEDVNSHKEREYLGRLKEELNSSGYLVTNYKDKNINGQFDDELWVFLDHNSKTHLLLDFNSKEIEQLKFKGLKSSDITRLNTCLRITGSRPSRGSSRIRTSGIAESESQNATCFFIPFERLLTGALTLIPKISQTFSKTEKSNEGK